MSVRELRKKPLPELLALLKQLGLAINGITSTSAALTRLMETAIEIEIDE